MFQDHIAELTRLSKLDLSQPELNKIYSEKRQEVDKFDKDVKATLEKIFQPGQFRSATAVLLAIPTGDLPYIFDTWLTELMGLGALSQDQVNAIQEEVKLL